VPKRIGLLFGMEDTFPWALVRAIDALGGGEVTAGPVEISYLEDRQSFDYALILDRISHEVPFYRTFLKTAAARGVQIVNNPFWWSADDKYFGNIVAGSVGVETPRTVLLPHKQRPPNTEATSFRNLRLVDWDAVFGYLGFPIFLKPAYGGGWKDVYKCDDPAAFFAAYDQTRDLTMMAQEAIDFTDYYRIYVVGRERVHLMPYDPRAYFHERYARNPAPAEPRLEQRLRRDALALSAALGYDMNTVELAVRGGIPYAIDFTNPAPDADLNSVGEANFAWIVGNMAEVLVDRVLHPRPFELTGSWPHGLVREPA
jgi:glutathione synthase/RimK-type ligase-like ATP-grasp enzyme